MPAPRLHFSLLVTSTGTPDLHRARVLDGWLVAIATAKRGALEYISDPEGRWELRWHIEQMIEQEIPHTSEELELAGYDEDEIEGLAGRALVI